MFILVDGMLNFGVSKLGLFELWNFFSGLLEDWDYGVSGNLICLCAWLFFFCCFSVL